MLCWAQAGASVHTPLWAAVIPMLPGAQPASHMDRGLGFLSEGTGMGLFHSWTSTEELEQHQGSSGITQDDLLLSKSSQEAHLLQWHWQEPGALAEVPTYRTCLQPLEHMVHVDQSQVVCMVLFCVQAQSSTVRLGLCICTKKWSNEKIVTLKVTKQHDRVCGSEISNTFKNCIFAFSRKYFSLRTSGKLFFKVWSTSHTCSNNAWEREEYFWVFTEVCKIVIPVYYSPFCTLQFCLSKSTVAAASLCWRFRQNYYSQYISKT